MVYPNKTDNYSIELFNQNFRELEEKTKQLEGEIGGGRGLWHCVHKFRKPG